MISAKPEDRYQLAVAQLVVEVFVSVVSHIVLPKGIEQFM